MSKKFFLAEIKTPKKQKSAQKTIYFKEFVYILSFFILKRNEVKVEKKHF